MKKLCMIMLLIMIFTLPGCGKSEKVSAQNSSEKEAIVSIQDDKKQDNNNNTETSESLLLSSINKEASNDVDIDLSVLEDATAFAEISDIMSLPDVYVGRSLKLTGVHQTCQNEDGTIYHVCVLEYNYGTHVDHEEHDDHVIVEFMIVSGDYPEDGAEVTIEGVFDSYFDEYNSMNRYYIRDAKLM